MPLGMVPGALASRASSFPTSPVRVACDRWGQPCRLGGEGSLAKV